MTALVLMLWITLSIVPPVIANKKGRGVAVPIIVSLLFSPLIGIVVAFAMQPDRRALESRELISGQSKRCPKCAELVRAAAETCRYCNYTFGAPKAAVFKD